MKPQSLPPGRTALFRGHARDLPDRREVLR
jgi:hypothetical protein